MIPKTDVTATKVWVDGPAEKPVVELQLYRNGVPHGDIRELASGVTTATWTGLDKTNASGVAYTYTVDEVEVPEDYVRSLDGLAVTNTYVSPKLDVTATKVWVGAYDSNPTVQVQLFRDGVELGDPVALESGETTATWTVDKTDAAGVEYDYTVDEVEVPEGYRKVVDGLTITNSRIVIPVDDPDAPAREGYVRIEFVAATGGSLAGTLIYDVLEGTLFGDLAIPVGVPDTGWLVGSWSPVLPDAEEPMTASAIFTLGFERIPAPELTPDPTPTPTPPVGGTPTAPAAPPAAPAQGVTSTVKVSAPKNPKTGDPVLALGVGFGSMSLAAAGFAVSCARRKRDDA